MVVDVSYNHLRDKRYRKNSWSRKKDVNVTFELRLYRHFSFFFYIFNQLLIVPVTKGKEYNIYHTTCLGWDSLFWAALSHVSIIVLWLISKQCYCSEQS